LNRENLPHGVDVLLGNVFFRENRIRDILNIAIETVRDDNLRQTDRSLLDPASGLSAVDAGSDSQEVDTGSKTVVQAISGDVKGNKSNTPSVVGLDGLIVCNTPTEIGSKRVSAGDVCVTEHDEFMRLVRIAPSVINSGYFEPIECTLDHRELAASQATDPTLKTAWEKPRKGENGFVIRHGLLMKQIATKKQWFTNT
jgi:hypothetical protein